MNPDQPSREQIEARLTALLLGELPAAEAELLRWSIERDPELKKLHDQLKLTIGFVREAMKNPSGAPVEKETALKMSAERRHKLLAHFKTDRPKPLVPPLRRKMFPLVPTLVVVAIAALLAAMLLPTYYAARTSSLHMVGNLSALNDMQQIPASGELNGERKEFSARLQPATPTVTRNPQESTTPPPMAQIVLPKTEQSQMESSQGESMQVVGYVNVNPGVSAITPVQPEPNSAQGIEAGPSPMPAPAAPQPETETQPILATANTSLSFKPPQTEGKIPPTVAGGNYTWSATGPNSAPVVELPSVSAIVPSPSSVPTQAVPESALASAGTFPSAAPAPAPEELSDSIREKALKDRSNFYGGGVGGGGGGGAGGIGFRTGVIPSNAYANNTFGLSGQAGLGSGTVSFGGAINGTPHLSPSDNITITNAIAENQGAFYRSINNSAGEGEEGQQPVLNWRLYQNPNNASQDDYKKIGVTPISGSAAPPTGMGNASAAQTDQPLTPPQANAPIPQPEIQTRDNAFSTFSLNVSDVSFKLASASLGNGLMPNPASIRGEEFINAFDYHDPEPLQGQPLAFMSERARDPFAQERDFLRFSIKAAAMGRQEGRALNLVLLLDTSGSMERADRVAIIREALRVLSAQLQPQDTVSVVTFARTARLWADGVPGGFAGVTLEKVGSITPEGGTNLEEAMRLAYETARRHFIANGMNRVVLLTDGAANLGNVDPQTLTKKVESERRKGIALDCFGIGWEDYNDDMLEQLSSNGDGRYAFINSPDEAATEFAAKLAGALQVAAEDVKVQVEFNPDRVTAWRQIGYAKHQLTKEQFRDNSVAAGAIASREAGNALYVIETKPDGEGPIATVRVRYRVPGTQDNHERSWLVDYTGTAPALAQASPAMRLTASAAEFSEWLSDSPYAQNVTPDDLLNYLSGIPQIYGADERPKQLEWMIRQAKSVSGK